MEGSTNAGSLGLGLLRKEEERTDFAGFVGLGTGTGKPPRLVSGAGVLTHG